MAELKEYLDIKDFIKNVQRDWIGSESLHLAYRFICTFSLSVLLIFAADNIFDFPRLLIAFSSLICPVSLGAFFLAKIMRAARIGRSPDYFAVFLEKSVPELKDKLINALQIGRDFSRGDASSGPLVRAVISDALQLIRGADIRQEIFKQDIRSERFRAIAAILAFLLYAGFFNLQFYNAIERFAFPLKKIAHYGELSLVVIPKDKTVSESSDLKIRALPAMTAKSKRCIIRYRRGARNWEKANMDADRIGFSYLLKNIEEPVRYRIEYGLLKSDYYRIGIKEYPKIYKISLFLRYPSYTNMKPKAIDNSGGNITALVGTEAKVILYATKRIMEAKAFVNEKEKSVDWDNSRNPSFSFMIEASGYYRLDVTYEGGLKPKGELSFNITALEDSSPEVVIKKPGRDTALSAADRILSISLAAADDFGVSKIALFGKPDTGANAEILKEWNVPEAGRRKFSGSFDIDLSRPDIKGSSIYKYWAEVYDANSARQGVGRSQEYLIKFISKEDEKLLRLKYIKDFLGGLEEILGMQVSNRDDLKSDKSMEKCLEVQIEIKDKSLSLINMLKEGVLPIEKMVKDLEDIANVDMANVINSLSKVKIQGFDRDAVKNEALPAMDEIIKKLSRLIEGVERLKELEEKGILNDLLDKKAAYEKLDEFRNALLKFIQEQDKAVRDAKELPKKYFKDYTDREKKIIEEIEKIEMKWQEVFTDSVDEIEKLTKLGFSSSTIVSGTRQILVDVEKVNEFFRSKEGIIFFIPVELMEGALALARRIIDNLEFGLQDRKDWRKWILEDVPEGMLPDIPIAPLPDTLYDLIGDLIEEQDAFNDEMDDLTSMWAVSGPQNEGYDAHDGPISNFSATGVTGNIMPDNMELTGRAGDGRAGRSSGELVEPFAKGLDGRNIPTRLTNDPYEKGVVQELRKQYVGGQTGGGKASGTTGLGLEGDFPPQFIETNERLKKGEEDIREKAERVRDKMEVIMAKTDHLDTAIELMKDIEGDLKDYRYKDIAKKSQGAIKNLDETRKDIVKSTVISAGSPSSQKESRRDILSSPQESYPEEFKDAISKYYKSLSDSER